MIDVAVNVLALVFVLGVMIFVHELGHFLTAKFFGIRVEVFALGFGPRLFGFRRGDTDYRVCALPLGGYVKMKGETPDEEITGAEDEFLSRPKLERFLVLVMGPAMNVALAFLLFTGVFLGGVQVEAWQLEPPVIGRIEPGSPAAEQTDLRPGDRVLSVDGEPVNEWRELDLDILISGGTPMVLTVERPSGAVREVELTPAAEGRSDQGYAGLLPPLPPVVAAVDPGGPADQVGILAGDRIVAVEGKPVEDFYEIQQIFAERPGERVPLTVERDGRRLEVTPQLESRTLAGREIGYLGILREVVHQSFGLTGAMSRAVSEMGRQTALVAEILGRIFTGRMSVKTLSGPIEIARYSGNAAQTGDPRVLMMFMAVISLQLGLLNLLPIPVLDGGHIAVLGVEGLMRRDLSLRAKERLIQVGLVLLVALMAVVITFDVIKSLPEGWSWPF